MANSYFDAESKKDFNSVNEKIEIVSLYCALCVFFAPFAVRLFFAVKIFTAMYAKVYARYAKGFLTSCMRITPHTKIEIS